MPSTKVPAGESSGNAETVTVVGMGDWGVWSGVRGWRWIRGRGLEDVLLERMWIWAWMVALDDITHAKAEEWNAEQQEEENECGSGG